MPSKLNALFKKHITKRKLIDKFEHTVSYVQLIGFFLILIGVLYLLSKIIYPIHCGNTPLNGEKLAITFFIIMLGMSLAFPSMLRDKNDGLSTMRIVVFMMINVICILLLKIGWDAKNLADIQLNEYWMGVIAFVFGAKATQSYFESKFATQKETSTNVGMAAINYTNADIAKLALEQNQQYLKVKFPNIVSISDAVHNLDQTETHVIALYLKDKNSLGIPDKLEVKMSDGSIKTIATEIINNVGAATIHIAQNKDVISDSSKPDYIGSICCMVKSNTDPDFFGVVTSGHIYSNGSFGNCGGPLSDEQKKNILINGTKSGEWYFQLMNNQQDLAIAKLDSKPDMNDWL